VEWERACEINAPFFNSFVSRRPWTVVKLALSVEGAIAPASRQRRWLSGPAATAEVHRLRAGFDAIAVGLGTAIADDPALTARGDIQPRRAPTRLIFDDEARLPLDAQLVRTARDVPTIVVASRPDGARAAELEGRGVRVLRADSLEDAFERLPDAGIRSVLVEGGATLAGRLLTRGLLDRMVIFQTPVELGPGALGAFTSAPGISLADTGRFRPIATQAFGDDVMTTYALTPAPCSPD
jgi:diaminohydroxyphosphoribosylaminopyrimidine deaminase/5-amino-6-(5-phosphoribosylamino)uracil reductase